MKKRPVNKAANPILIPDDRISKSSSQMFSRDRRFWSKKESTEEQQPQNKNEKVNYNFEDTHFNEAFAGSW